ncbi:hypothetical protein [Massilia sp. DD77]|uniref:hypothetical protein n=1 Tax=Massilia sp. DD77 TaxID=3109349 RepID=UPI002FFF601F
MNDTAHIYRAEILRAVFGPTAHETKAHDLHRLNQIAQHLADCEEAQAILRAKGHGRVGMSFIEVASSVPNNVRRMLDNLFPSGLLGLSKQGTDIATPVTAPNRLGSDVHDVWSSR